MAEALLETIPEWAMPDMSQIITEDDEPVDNMFSEKQQRLLVEPLYSSWKPDRPFIAAANVGIFHTLKKSPIVPDMFLSLGVQADKDIWKKENRSYFLWIHGKPPEVVIEIVSNKEGGETLKKFTKYADIGIWYYVIFDPQQLVQEDILRVYEWNFGSYTLKDNYQLEHVGLSLKLWHGMFEELNAPWLRWSDLEGELIPSGLERADEAEAKATEAEIKATEAEAKATEAETKADSERQRAERLATKLREMGIEPDEL